jgi:beta-ureidopropionase
MMFPAGRLPRRKTVRRVETSAYIGDKTSQVGWGEAKMRIALVQMSMDESVQSNLEKTVAGMTEAAGNGAELVCFPEIQFSPFFPQFPRGDASRYAMGIDHAIVGALQQACRELGVVAIPNLYLEEGGKRYDASPVFDSNGAILGVSKMVHILQALLFYEQDYYGPSDAGFEVYDTSVGRIGVVICFDRHYPESVRTCALKGATLMVIPTANTKGEPLEFYEWELRVAAAQSGVFIAMCNRVGVEGEMDFCGESIVVDPSGGVVAKADDTEQILYAEIDFDLIEKSRAARPYLKLRRPEFCALHTAESEA